MDEDGQRFAQFDMRGERFNAPGMPADAVGEVAAFRRAVFSIAGQLWKDANHRARLPSHVIDHFDLRLIAIGEGSAKPIFRLHHDTALDGATLAEWEPFFATARDELTKTVRSLDQKGRPAPGFPRECLDDVARLGASLRPDEHVVVGSPEPGRRGAKYTNELPTKVRVYQRNVIIRGPRPVTIVGVITEYDSVRQSFQLRPSTGGGIIQCRIGVVDPQLTQQARDLCSLDGIVAPDVSVVGNTLDTGETVKMVDDVTEITEVRSVWEKRVNDRLSVLSALQDGWNGPGSVAPSTPALQALEALGTDMITVGHPLRIGATSGGAIAIEWSTAQAEFTAEIDRDMTLSLFVDHFEAEEVEEHQARYNPTFLMTFLSDGELP